MKKEQLKNFIILSCVIAVIGIILLFFSVRFGESLASNWLLSHGGFTDTDTYMLRMENYIRNFQAAGSIFLAIGLAAAMFMLYQFYQRDGEE